jgi:hypothetical protein
MLIAVAALIAGAIPAPSTSETYASVLQRVRAGESVVVYVGVPLAADAPPNAVSVPSFPGIESNRVLRCSLHNGRPCHAPYIAAANTQAITPPATVVQHATPPVVSLPVASPARACNGPSCKPAAAIWK